MFELEVLEWSSAGAGAVAGVGTGAVSEYSLCLKEYQTSVTPGGCSLGRVVSPAGRGRGEATLALPFSFRWTRSFSLVLEARDPADSVVGRASWAGLLQAGAGWHPLRDAGPPRLTYRVRVRCQTHYYGDTCTAFCRARDDNFGHYECSSDGHKSCLPGWRGDNCETRECSMLTSLPVQCVPVEFISEH